MIRGYSCYYNGIYLRSALEFAFAYYLDSKGIKWEYEKHFYDIGGEHYKPDFFIIGDRSEILEIAEIKGKKTEQTVNIKSQNLREYTQHLLH